MRINDVMASSDASNAGLTCAKADVDRCLSESADTATTFLSARVRDEASARALASRSVLVMQVGELWCEAASVAALLDRVCALCVGERAPELAACAGATFRFETVSRGQRWPRDEQTTALRRLGAFFPLCRTGRVQMKGAEHVFQLVVEFGAHDASNAPRRCFFVRHLRDGVRDCLAKYSLTTRRYIGPTSMAVELAMLTANQALVKPGHLVLDPFVGTGSLLVSAAHYGGYCFGGDIDPRVLHGKGGRTIATNFADYGMAARLIGYASTDLPHSALRQVPLWDAIVTDPPYGVRAGAKTVGMKARTAAKPDYHVDDPTNHFPQFLPYSLRDSLRDLLAFAARTLVLGGRLVYWLPSTSAFRESDFPLHPCLELLCWGHQLMSGDTRRLLVTMQKTVAYDAAVHANPDASLLGQVGETAHERFADLFSDSEAVQTARASQQQQLGSNKQTEDHQV